MIGGNPVLHEVAMRPFLSPLAALLALAPLQAARPLQVDDLFKVKRVADPQWYSYTGMADPPSWFGLDRAVGSGRRAS